MNLKKLFFIWMLLSVFHFIALCQPLPAVCTWFGDKSAAISLTYDDNMPLMLKYSIPEMNKRGLAGTFFICAIQIFDITPDWTLLSYAAATGHEIAGHSLNHGGDPAEVEPTLDSIKNHLPLQKWFTWAYPWGDESAYDEVSRLNIAARGWDESGIEDSVPADFYRIPTMGDHLSENNVSDAIAKRGWMVEGIHCIWALSDTSPTNEACGSVWMLPDYTAHLDTLVAYGSQIWVGRFGDVARYIRERCAAKMTFVSSDTSTYVFDLTDTLADSIYNYPLTLKMQLPPGWKSCSIMQGTWNLTFVMKGDTLLFNAVPDKGRIVLRRVTAPVSPFIVSLWPDSAPEGGASPAIKVYLAPGEKANGAAVVICPGGAYSELVSGPEGDAPAEWLNTLGVAGIVLSYRLGHHPIPMEDGQRAMQVVRAHAAEWGLDTGRIGIMGFSAGGHVASSVGVHFLDCAAKSGDYIDQLSCCPSFMILIYPVISFYLGWGPPLNVVGNPPDEAIMDYLANDRRVTAQTPPTFLAHAADDDIVPPVNSIAFHDSCVSHSVPAELHIYPHGGHGFYPYDSTISMWAKDGDDWMRRMGFYSYIITDNEPGVITPENLELAASPNPFNPTTHISYYLAQKSQVSLVLYNLQGKVVRKLANGVESSGKAYCAAGCRRSRFRYLLMRIKKRRDSQTA